MTEVDQKFSKNNGNGTARATSLWVILCVGGAAGLLTSLGFLILVDTLGWSVLSQTGSCLDLGGEHLCLIRGDETGGDLLSALSSFYTNVIVILIALLTVVLGLSFFSLKYSAKAHVDSELPELTDGFFQYGRGAPLIKDAVSRHSETHDEEIKKEMREKVERDLLNSRAEVDGLLMRIDEMQEKIDGIEYHLESLDSGELVIAPGSIDQDEGE
ncbi:MAG: hypothetical protein N4A65_00715 [Cohaesibacter sp.]|jgi:hypothetical protein|nr:hypothetical protein [Cohaesibacter sp.]